MNNYFKLTIVVHKKKNILREKRKDSNVHPLKSARKDFEEARTNEELSKSGEDEEDSEFRNEREG